MNKTIHTPIIPSQVDMVGNADELDLKAICIFVAIGFFLGEDTYFKGLKAL